MKERTYSIQEILNPFNSVPKNKIQARELSKYKWLYIKDFVKTQEDVKFISIENYYGGMYCPLCKFIFNTGKNCEHDNSCINDYPDSSDCCIQWKNLADYIDVVIESKSFNKQTWNKLCDALIKRIDGLYR